MGMGTQNMPQMGLGRVGLHVTMGIGMATFHVCQNSHRSTHTSECMMASLMSPVLDVLVLIGVDGNGNKFR